MRWFLLVFLALLAMPLAYSLKPYDIDCFDDGHVELTLEGENDSKAYTEDIEVKSNGKTVQGSWGSLFIKKSDSAEDQYGKFVSREGIFDIAKNYDINIDYILAENATASYKQSLAVSVSCPGLLFSCSLLNISIQECYTKNGKFNAVIAAPGLKQSGRAEMDFDKVTSYILRTRENYIDKNLISSRKGELPAVHEVAYIKDGKYLLAFDFADNFVESLYVQFNDELFRPCSEAEYTFKRTDLRNCGEEPQEAMQQEKPAEQETLHIEQPAEVAEEEKPQQAAESLPIKEETTKSKTIKVPEEETNINPKTILMLAFIMLIIGAITVYLLKQRDIM